MRQSWLSLTIGWFPVIAVATLIGISLWRRLWRELPLFSLYLVSALLVGIVRYATLWIGQRVYFYAYWTSDLTISVIAFFPLYEIFLRRVFAKFHKTGFYRSVFPAVAIAVLGFAILSALQAHDRNAAFLVASRTFDIMRTTVLIFFMGLMLFMGRRWTRYELGITLGFAVQAAVALANSAVRTLMHYRPSAFDTFEIAAYDVSCLVWLVTFIRPEQTQLSPPKGVDHDVLDQARTWESMLKTWLIPKRNKVGRR